MPPSLYFLFLGWCFFPLFLAAGFVDFSAFDLSGALLNVLIILKLFYYYFFIFIFCACFGWVLQPIQKCNYMWIDYLVLTLEIYTKSHWNSKFFGRSKWQFDFFLLWKSRKEKWGSARLVLVWSVRVFSCRKTLPLPPQTTRKSQVYKWTLERRKIDVLASFGIVAHSLFTLPRFSVGLLDRLQHGLRRFTLQRKSTTPLFNLHLIKLEIFMFPSRLQITSSHLCTEIASDWMCALYRISNI